MQQYPQKVQGSCGKVQGHVPLASCSYLAGAENLQTLPRQETDVHVDVQYSQNSLILP